MKWLIFLLVAIALHLLVLLCFSWSSSTSILVLKPGAEVTHVSPPAPLPALPVSPTPPAASALETPITSDATKNKPTVEKTASDITGGHDGNSSTVGVNPDGKPYKVIAVSGGITARDAEVEALAWGGRLANLQSAEEEQEVFKLVDDPKYWRDTNTASFGPWLGGDFRYKLLPDLVRVPPDFFSQTVHTPPEGKIATIGPHVNAYATMRKEAWGIYFQGPAPNQRLLNAVWSESYALANGFVVQYAPIPLRADDVSLAKGHLGNHTFEVFVVSPKSRGIDWVDAERQAQARGGYLAIIHTAEENNFVFQLINQQAGAWKPFKTKYHQVHGGTTMATYDLGPWLGGYNVLNRRPLSGWNFDKQNGWRWFHFVTSPEETRLSADTIPYLNWASHGDMVGVNITGYNTGSISGAWDDISALYYAKLDKESIPTWAEMHIHELNGGYVVEYDDPPVAAN